jgi:DNA-binding CsgD family transcriptional regulator
MAATTTGPLRGRESVTRSLAALGRTLTDATGMLVAGEPGVGRSALLAAVAETVSGSGVRAVVATAVPSHHDRPLSLFRELLELLHRPRAPRTDSLEELVTDTLAAAARERPTLVLLDDAHLADEMSWEALTHAARVLHEEAFVLVATMPEGDPRFRQSGLPTLTLDPLGPDAAAALLDDVAPGLPVFVRHRILEASAGNPLALHELGAASVDGWRRRCVRAPAALPMTPRLVHAFAAPLERLAPAGREVVLAAAANDSSSLSEAVRAAAITLGVSTEETLQAFMPACDARIVESDGVTVLFRSEVSRSAIYQAASLPRRHAIHVALDGLLRDEPHRAAWHRAAASLRPDEALAVELAAAATAARAQGRIVEALATMDRAARVSQDPEARVDRALDAAEMAFELGRPDFVRSFVETATGLARTPLHHQRLRWIRNLYEIWGPDNGRGALELMRTAEHAAADGDASWLRTLVTRAVEKSNVTPLALLPRAELLEIVERLGGPAAYPALVGVLSVVAPVERGAEVLGILRASPEDAGGDPRLARVLADAALTLGDDALAIGFFSESIDRLRLEGRLGFLPFALADRARAYTGTASLGLARADAAEAALMAEEADQGILLGRIRALQAQIEGTAGDEEQARARAEQAERAVVDRPALMIDVHAARGVTALAAGAYDEAYERLLRLWDDAKPAIVVSRRWAFVADLADAAVHSGRADAVRPIVDALTLTAAAVPSPVLRANVDHAQAILAPDDQAEDAFLRARESARARGTVATGRVDLAYGIWLRRRRRVAEARLALRAAVAAFDAQGAHPWSARAAGELRAAGIGGRHADPGTRDELTPQEREIAELAATGLSNREIGQRLFLSHRTIGTHLYRVFPKLGITSRSQLRDALAEQGGADAA